VESADASEMYEKILLKEFWNWLSCVLVILFSCVLV